MTKLTIEITEFDNSALADNPQAEVAGILNELVPKIRRAVDLTDLDGSKLLDINGNVVGVVRVS